MQEQLPRSQGWQALIPPCSLDLGNPCEMTAQLNGIAA
jgi:hypothetical protein